MAGTECKSNRETFEQLFEEYYGKVYVYILHRVNNSKDAEDLAEDVFLKAFKNPHDPNIAKFSTYIYTIASNTLKNYYRSVQRAGEILSGEEADENLSDGTDIIGSLITREEHRELAEALAQLPRRQYEAVYRRYYLEQSFKEIGAALDTTEDAAKKLHKRALENLRKSKLVHENDEKNFNHKKNF